MYTAGRSAVKSTTLDLSLFPHDAPTRPGGWHERAESDTISPVNEESLRRANAFLEAIAREAEPGSMIDTTPAELGKQVGVVEPLAAARAVRALLARRRLEAVDGRYRLLDTRPIEPGEREQVPRPPRSQKRSSAGGTPKADGRATYSEIGRELVEQLLT